ncbi:MAG: antitoxin VapB family protein [Nanoarchaeota archaeon]
MTKVISISDDVYNSLKNLKKPGESFSIVIRKLVKKRKSKKGLLSLAGIWKNNEEMVKIMNNITEDRKKFKVGN